MSAVCILAPVVVAAATSMGYEVAASKVIKEPEAPRQKGEVLLEIEQSEIVTDQLGREQQIVVTRDGVSITFSRDVRGRASLCVSGDGYTDDQLRGFGEELSQRVVQQYVYQKLVDEMRARNFLVVEEEVDATHAIRLKVRHWEN